jgi:hypothetical protein
MKKRLERHGVVVLMVVLTGVAAHGATVWDNGAAAAIAANQGGSNKSDTVQSEDFQLLATMNLTGISFWDLQFQAASADYNGSIFWKIVGDSGGSPNDSFVIGSGTSTPTRTPQGTVNVSSIDFFVFQNDFNIVLNGVLSGTYWLELHNGPLASNAFTDFYWSFTDPNVTNSGTNPGHEMGLNPVTSWTTNDTEHAFNISGDAAGGVPEPATALMAFGAMVGLIWRKTRKA